MVLLLVWHLLWLWDKERKLGFRATVDGLAKWQQHDLVKCHCHSQYTVSREPCWGCFTTRDLDGMTSCVDGQGQEDGLAIYQAVCELLISSRKFTWGCLPASLLSGAAVLAREQLGNSMSAQAAPLCLDLERTPKAQRSPCSGNRCH